MASLIILVRSSVVSKTAVNFAKKKSVNHGGAAEIFPTSSAHSLFCNSAQSFSSLAYWHRYPVSRFLIAQASSNESRQLNCWAIFQMSEKMPISLVALNAQIIRGIYGQSTCQLVQCMLLVSLNHQICWLCRWNIITQGSCLILSKRGVDSLVSWITSKQIIPFSSISVIQILSIVRSNFNWNNFLVFWQI